MDLTLAFLAGFLGSVHCVGMCGPIVLACSAGCEARAGSHLMYNGGRVIAYALIGALAGLAGGAIGSIRAAAPWLSLAAGAVMIVAGMLMPGFLPPRTPGVPVSARRLHLTAVTNLVSLRTPESAFYVGLLTPFLPCGLLYAMVARAAAGGGPVQGASIMLAFGTGIIPALFLAGVASSYLSSRLRLHATRLASVMVIIMGIVLILRGLGVPMPFMGTGHMHHPG